VNWWYDDYDYSNSQKKEDSIELSWFQKVCMHNWKATMLIVSVVYDCTKCGVKKEDYDAYYNNLKVKYE